MLDLERFERERLAQEQAKQRAAVRKKEAAAHARYEHLVESRDVEALSRIASDGDRDALRALSRIASVPGGPRSGRARKELMALVTPRLEGILGSPEELEIVLRVLKVRGRTDKWLQERVVVGTTRDYLTDDVEFVYSARLDAGKRMDHERAAKAVSAFWRDDAIDAPWKQTYGGGGYPGFGEDPKSIRKRAQLSAEKLLVARKSLQRSDYYGDATDRLTPAERLTVVRLDRDEFLVLRETGIGSSL